MIESTPRVCVSVAAGVVMTTTVVMLLPLVQATGIVTGMPLLGQLSFDLNPRARPRAMHGDRHRAPDGEQHGQQQQEPEAEGLHNS